MTGVLLVLFAGANLLAPTVAVVNGILVSMQLLDLFDLSLAGRASSDALEYDRADGSVDKFTFGDLDARSDHAASRGATASAFSCRTASNSSTSFWPASKPA
jgi:hypothetical protein